MYEFLGKIQDLGLSQAVRGDLGYEWLFPIVETFHVFFLALVFGSIVMVDLRLLGLTSRDSLVSRLSREVLPWTWVAFILAACSGTMLFMSKAQTYFYNREFDLKFLFMFLAGINMMVFHFGIYRKVGSWDSTFPTPAAARVAGAVSLLCWSLVIVFGRWIGFTT
ncbi:MAG TPA: DUF6644 family protein [Steroidobacteraceae bacterium]|nr:DUF6644 family protein [Steroidobacteraceae bacterium]